MKYLIILLSVLFIISSCVDDSSDNSSTEDTIIIADATGDSEEESETTETTIAEEETVTTVAEEEIATTDSETDTSNIITNLTGYIQDGPCLSGADVFIYPLNSTTLAQTGAKFQGITINNFGAYEVSAEIDIEINPYAEVFTDASCHNEITGGIMAEKTYRAIVDWTAGEANNINPPSTATVSRILALHTTPGSPTYQNQSASKAQAESEYLAAHNITGITTPFTDMALDSSSDANAALLAMNVVHLYGHSEAEQSAFLADMGEDLKLDGTIDSTTLKNKIKNNSMAIGLVNTRDNLKARYLALGQSIESPKFWNFIDSYGNGQLNKDNSQSFVNIISNRPTLNHTVNLSESCSSSFDTADNRFFAFPYIFDEDVTSDFIGTNVTGDYMSWYNNDDKGDGDHNNDWPGTLIQTGVTLQRNFFIGTFEDAELNEYSNLPSELHVGLEYTFISGVKYWKIIWADENYQPSMGCPVGLVSFARNLHSADGINWVGSDQNGSSYRGNKFKMFITQ